MDEFEFFFAFYGLILGLAVAELLNGLAGLVRARQLRRLGPQTALLAAFVLLAVVATWIDAWRSLRDVELSMGHLALPFLIGALYYLAAVSVFPKDPDAWATLDDYFAERKRYVAMILLAAEVMVTVTSVPLLAGELQKDPARFWGWLVPYNVVIKGFLIGLILSQGRRLNLVLLGGLILLFLIPYWEGRQ